MQTGAQKLAAAGSEMYPIRTVADLTGVNPITLRAWERRYGLLEPIRRPSGHRLYTQAHIDLVNRIVGLLERGMRIGQVKDLLVSHEGAEDRPEGGTWKAYQDRMVAAVIRFDEFALEDVYGEALSNYPVQAVTDRLIKPLLAELGRRWAQGEGSIAEEHFFAFYMRNKLGARFHHRVKPHAGPRLLLSCLPGDRHETGLLLFALAANDAGMQTILLGADMPLGELPAAVHKTGSEAIVMSGMMVPGDDILETQLPALVETVEVPVFVGGHASVKAHDAITRAGAEALGINMDQGLARLHRALGTEGANR